MLEIRHLTKIYEGQGGQVRALDDVSVQFPDTGLVFILGKSGCGKSTFLNCTGGAGRSYGRRDNSQRQELKGLYWSGL